MMSDSREDALHVLTQQRERTCPCADVSKAGVVYSLDLEAHFR